MPYFLAEDPTMPGGARARDLLVEWRCEKPWAHYPDPKQSRAARDLCTKSLSGPALAAALATLRDAGDDDDDDDDDARGQAPPPAARSSATSLAALALQWRADDHCAALPPPDAADRRPLGGPRAFAPPPLPLPPPPPLPPPDAAPEHEPYFAATEAPPAYLRRAGRTSPVP